MRENGRNGFMRQTQHENHSNGKKLGMILKLEDVNCALFCEWVLIKITVFRCFSSICAPVVTPRMYVVRLLQMGGLREGKECSATESSVNPPLHANHYINIAYCPSCFCICAVDCSISIVKMLNLLVCIGPDCMCHGSSFCSYAHKNS